MGTPHVFIRGNSVIVCIETILSGVAVCCSVLQCVALIYGYSTCVYVKMLRVCVCRGLYHMLQFVEVCCSVLQCVAVCCSVLHVCVCRRLYRVLQFVEVCCSVWQCVAVCCAYVCVEDCIVCGSLLRCVAACCDELSQYIGTPRVFMRGNSAIVCIQKILSGVAACCSVLQCVESMYGYSTCVYKRK